MNVGTIRSYVSILLLNIDNRIINKMLVIKNLTVFFKTYDKGTRETAQQLRALVLGNNTGLVPSTHIMAHSHP